MKDFLQSITGIIKEEDPTKRLQMFNDHAEDLKKYDSYDPDKLVEENEELKNDLSETKGKLNEVTMTYFDTFGKSGGDHKEEDNNDNNNEGDKDEKLEPLSLNANVTKM